MAPHRIRSGDRQRWRSITEAQGAACKELRAAWPRGDLPEACPVRLYCIVDRTRCSICHGWDTVFLASKEKNPSDVKASRLGLFAGQICHMCTRFSDYYFLAVFLGVA